MAIYAFLLAPMIVVVATSFDPSGAFHFPPSGLSLKWYAAFFGSESFVHDFFEVSLVVASVVSLLAVILGGLAAIGLVRFPLRGRAIIEAFFLSPLVVPGILLGVALFLFYTRVHIEGTLMALVIGHILLAMPYVIRTISAGLVGFDVRLEEAAMSLGATRVEAFLKVTLPLIRSALFSGAVFAFIISFSDINLTLFIAGPGVETLPVHIFSQILFQGDPTISAASTLQIVLIAVLYGTAQRLFRLRVAL